MKPKGVAAICLSFLMILVIGVIPVMASNPHFVWANASINNAGSLVVSWKEAGLGNNQLIDYIVSADAAGLYACINGGSNHPQASNKEAFAGPVSSTGTFSSGKNGQITASLSAAPPAATLVCPTGQRLVLACVTYSNIALADVTNNIPAPIPGAVSKTFFGLPECP